MDLNNCDLLQVQNLICANLKTGFLAFDENLKIGISKNVLSNLQPLNGLRHNPTSTTNGWYFWRGEIISDEVDFFLPLHGKHLEEWAPQVMKYLGLPPGWRFLIAEDFEDVWFDETLITS